MTRYIYPPRPAITVHPRQLCELEATEKWWWQYKYDGDRMVVSVEKGKISLGNRYGKFYPPYKHPTLRAAIQKLALPVDKTYYLDGELLEPSGQPPILVLFDILYCEKELLAATQEQRFDMLADLCQHPKTLCADKIAFEISPGLWLAIHGDKNFLQHFQETANHKLVEGVLLRRKGSCLHNGGSGGYDVDWQIRCRHPTKNYPF
jgi:ATP-dependent DNA ligase